MFGISFSELVVIFVVGLIVLGPEKLPQALRWIGKISGELRKTSEGLRREFYNAVYEPARQDLSEARKELSALRSEFIPSYRLDPSCPDTIAKRAQTLNQSAAAIVTTPPSSAPTKTLDASPVVDIPLAPGMSVKPQEDKAG